MKGCFNLSITSCIIEFLDTLDDIRDSRLAAHALQAWRQDPSTGKRWEQVKEELSAEGLLDE